MTTRRTTAAITAALVLSAVSGCAWTADRASAALRADMPTLISTAGFERMPDWRSIGYPTDDIRTYFGYDSTYRVIHADVDDATLAVWRTGPQGAEPMFDENVVATGSACVDLRREPDAVSSTVVDCPVALSEVQPWADDHSWGKDAVAVASATAAIDAAVEDVRRLLISAPVDGPHTAERVTASMVHAAEADRAVDDSLVVASDVAQDGRIVTLTLTATAITPEAVDTTRTATARWCARLRVDLDDPYPNTISDEGPCS